MRVMTGWFEGCDPVRPGSYLADFGNDHGTAELCKWDGHDWGDSIGAYWIDAKPDRWRGLAFDPDAAIRSADTDGYGWYVPQDWTVEVPR